MSTPFTIYKDAKDEWRWTLWAANHSDKIADSGEGYKNRKDCLNGIRIVMATNSQTPVQDKTTNKWLDPSEIASSGS